ncbi:hypothetical protein GCM10025857_31740 [Alicyclobacillus contaminans]|nr:hypothetical protein GCM10025857_31740 [Alicyclobacillus contaminans]
MRRMCVGKRLTGIRRRAGVSLGHMSRKLGMSREELIDLENSVTIDPSWVGAYMDALGLEKAK